MNNKSCGCGRKYNALTWSALPLTGYMEDTSVSELELRNCPCGSTIAVSIPRYQYVPVVPLGKPFFVSESTIFSRAGLGCATTLLPPAMEVSS